MKKTLLLICLLFVCSFDVLHAQILKYTIEKTITVDETLTLDPYEDFIDLNRVDMGHVFQGHKPMYWEYKDYDSAFEITKKTESGRGECYICYDVPQHYDYMLCEFTLKPIKPRTGGHHRAYFAFYTEGRFNSTPDVLSMGWVEMEYNITVIEKIYFADPEVKRICVENWDTNGDGEIWNTELSIVTSLGNAFKGNKEIRTVKILDYFTSLTSIGDSVFFDCSGLTSITIPNFITSLGRSAFEGCTSLPSIDIPNSVHEWLAYIFKRCTGLTSITIPSYIGHVASSAFEGCTNLSEVTIPNSVYIIDSYAFRGCTSLKNITIPNSVLWIGVGAFEKCTSLTSIVFPSSLRSINSSAFADCTGLTSIVIPSSVTSIGGGSNLSYNPFSGCNLTSIKVESGNPVFETDNRYSAIIEKETKTLISGSMNTVIPNTVISIGDKAFYNCTGLTSINIPNSVMSIGNFAFIGCSGLKEVLISDLKAWLNLSWHHFRFLSRYGAPYEIIDINNPLFYAHHLFLNGIEINNLSIPSSVTSIPAYAFSGWTNLNNVTINNNVKSIGSFSFYGCSGLTSITIPNSVTIIEEGSFLNCSGLTSVIIPNSITSIGRASFRNCSGLTSITIPNSIESFGGCAFDGCTRLETIYSMIEQPFAIDDNVFYNGRKEFTSATLYVPRGTKAKYETIDGWKNFTTIIEMGDQPKGDVNGDQTVDVADIASVISVMAGSANVSSAQADVNSDGVVDVADIATIISEMAARARMLNEAEE